MKTKILITVFTVFALLTSCKKAEKGAVGPAGTSGTNGNANVKAFYFGKDSITTGDPNITLSLPSPVNDNMIDSSVVLTYHKVGTAWYLTPGFGFLGGYQTRVYVQNASVYIIALNPNSSAYSGGKVIFDKLKVIIIPSSDYKGSRVKAIDFTDYEATMKYYGLTLD